MLPRSLLLGRGYIGYVAVRWTGNFYLGIAAACVGVGILGMPQSVRCFGAWRADAAPDVDDLWDCYFVSGCGAADLQRYPSV